MMMEATQPKYSPDDVLIHFNLIGNCEIDSDLVAKYWDKTWFLSQYGDQFTLCQRDAGREKPGFKVAIDRQIAKKLIKRLALVETKSPVFVRTSSWRREGEYDGMP